MERRPKMENISLLMNAARSSLIWNLRSRCRGLEGSHSDLDVVVELSGNEREDDLFDLLHEDDFSIGGVKVDINPITKNKTGTLEE